jgi:hypothetical protein
LPVSDPLAFCAGYRLGGTFHIVEAKLFAVIVPKIIFLEITMKVLLFAVLVDTAHPALEDREVAFNA